MKICSNCGKECNDDIKFCMFCGNPFPAAEEIVTPEETAADEPAAFAEPPQEYSGQEYAPQEYTQQTAEEQASYQQAAAPQSPQPNAGQQYNAQPYGNQPYQQYAGPAEPEKGYCGFSIAALVLGIVSVFLGAFIVPPVLAIIFGAIGMGKAKQGYKGRGMAIAGLVLGIVMIVIYLILIIMAVALGMAVISGLGGALGALGAY